LTIAEYPGVIMTHSQQELRNNVVDGVVPSIVHGLMTPVQTTEKPVEPGPADVVFEGTLDEVNEHFLEAQWTDGLPIVPPTRERVNAFLRFTPRAPGELIGVLAPD